MVAAAWCAHWHVGRGKFCVTVKETQGQARMFCMLCVRARAGTVFCARRQFCLYPLWPRGRKESGEVLRSGRVLYLSCMCDVVVRVYDADS